MKSYLKINEERALNEFINRVKAELSENVLVLRLFGSKVRGDYTSESDIDVLIILKNKSISIVDKIVDALVDSQIEYDANISPVIFSEKEYKKNVKLGSPFIQNINKESIVLV